jgi:signal transduction histidine kinase
LLSEIVPHRNPIKVVFSLEPLKAVLFLLLSFILWFVVISTVVSIGAVGVVLILTLVLAIVGVPLTIGMFVAIPYLCHAERWRIKVLTGFEIPNPYKPLPHGPLSDKVRAFLKDGALWRDILYVILMFPISLAEFVILTVGLTVPFTLIAMPWVIAIEGSGEITGIWTITSPIEALPLFFAGVFLLGVSAYMFTAIARVHGLVARWLIGPSDIEALTQRVETLSDTRSRMVGVSLDDRRNIERNIHDSTQPRLVSLAMNLGIAREKLDSDPNRAKELIDQAHQEAKDVLVELRHLVRGLHPSILTDRGLEAAIPALAGHCTVPVTVDVHLDERPPEIVETTAYYVVAEALANVAKHSNASEAHVVIQRDNGYLRIDIVDDGRGGATLSPGGGLTGILDRVEALDGSLEVVSPEGGPTRLSARIPCAS